MPVIVEQETGPPVAKLLQDLIEFGDNERTTSPFGKVGNSTTNVSSSSDNDSGDAEEPAMSENGDAEKDSLTSTEVQ